MRLVAFQEGTAGAEALTTVLAELDDVAAPLTQWVLDRRMSPVAFGEWLASINSPVDLDPKVVVNRCGDVAISPRRGANMDTALAQTLIDVLVIIGLLVLICLALSPPAYIVKLVFQALGVESLARRLGAWAAPYGSLKPHVDRFLERLDQAVDRASASESVEVVLDARHRRLGQALKAAEGRIRETVASVEAMTAVAGPRTVLKEIDDLRDRTKLVNKLGVEFDDDLSDQYVGRSRARVALVFSVLFILLLAALNGSLLNMFFRDLIPLRVLGFPLSLAIAIAFVAAEMVLGSVLSWFGTRPNNGLPKVVLISAIVIFACFEAIVLGMVSNEFELNLALLDDQPILRFWMGPVGFALVCATAFSGYMFHESLHELAAYRGAQRLAQETKQANAFVAALPRAWEAIDHRATQARSQVESYLVALKGKAGELGGIVKEIKDERGRLSDALLDARPGDWNALAEGGAGDKRTFGGQNAGLFVLSVLTVAAFSTAVSFLLFSAVGTALHAALSISIAIAVAFLFYGVGLLPYARLRLTTGDHSRCHPMPAGVLEYVVAGIMAVLGFVGLIWIGVVSLGLWGSAVGALLFGVGLLLSVLGYNMARAARGAMLLLTVLMLVVLLVTGVFLSLVLFVVLSLAAIVLWLIVGLVWLLAKPLELLVAAFRGRRPSGPQVPTAGAAS